jgi:O-antigen/teichoic acid export membrane protein
MRRFMVKFQNIYFYSFLNYIDKGINFLVPFVILKLVPDGDIYGKVEYIISLSLLLSSFLDFGLRTYFLYAYRKSIDREKFIINANSILLTLLFFYVTVFLLYGFIFGVKYFYIFCIPRFIFLTFINIKGVIFRLEDKQSSIFIYSLLINILIIVSVFLSYLFELKFDLFIYSMSYILFCIGVFFNFAKKNMLDVGKIKIYFYEIMNSIKFSWPLILVLFFATMQNNLLKIYGYNNLNTSEFERLSIFLRFFFIMILAHGAAINYYSKYIYIEKEIFNINNYLRYLFIISIGFVFMFFCIYLSNRFSIFHYIKINVPFMLMLFTYILMMNRTYFEQYFGKYNKLYSLLYSSIISFLSLIILLLFTYIKFGISINSLLIILLISEIINTLLVFTFYKIVIKNEAKKNHISIIG